MFEDSLTMSGGHGRTRKPLTVVISAVIHVVLVTVLVLIPLIYTEALPGRDLMTFLEAPPPPPPPPPPPAPVEVVQREVVRVEEVQIDPNAMIAPLEIPTEIAYIEDAPPEAAVGGVVGGFGVPGGALSGVLGGVLDSIPNAAPPPPPPPPPPVAAPVEPIRIGGQVAEGRIIEKPLPEYPSLARTTRTEGTVILEATIGIDGTIQDLRVITGPSLLRDAAMDAVRRWRYVPYELNGDPVPVTTTVTVNFSLGRQ